MQTFRDSNSMRGWSGEQRAQGERVGLVPTMGSLHEGHLSLVRIAKEKGCGAVAASIFVNPAQFGPGEDFERYPRDEVRDLAMLESEGVAAVFLPGVKEMYPDGYQTYVEVTGASQGLCGARRPGHFRGVATVVAKLLLAARPHVAVFGQKDFQQLAVIRRMVRDLGLDVEIEGAPIVREADGLAMSSRNRYLQGEDRIAALCLYRGLCAARDLYAAGARDPETLVNAARAKILSEPRAAFEYAEARDPETLSPVRLPAERMTILVAARVGPARLIDNITLGGSAP
ncbi:MAG TPA: pantoate--beta-alanine ligase [Candidatus Deferrimicrobiaceae bacterium]|nr:pantoate--beta-alanine ligase [Candidatus Deferrimicrobiaceae bacterium]